MSRPATTRLKLNPPLGNLPTLQFVRPGDIRVDPAYQRSMEAKSSQSLIRRMAQHWNWDLCQPLVLARRVDLTERLFVIDGQHRLEAAKLRGDIDQLPCVIVNYANPADEAASFVHLNQQRRPLTKLDLFKAAVASEDPEACAIIVAMKKCGLLPAPHANFISWKPGMVQNIGGLERAWRVHGPLVSKVAMKLLARSYPTEALRYAGSLFPGLLAIAADEVEAGADGGRFRLVVQFVGETTQRDWYRAIGTRTGEIPTLNLASAAVFRDAWATRAPPTAPPAPPPALPAVEKIREAIAAEPVKRAPPPLPAPTFAPPKETDGKQFCNQCDSRVSLTSATLCKDRFCKVRPALSASA